MQFKGLIDLFFSLQKLLDKRNLNIKDVNYEIIGLERHIESLSEIPTTWQMYFTNDGYFIYLFKLII